MDQQLDTFGQNPRFSRLYTQLAFCFELNTSQADVIRALEVGLDTLVHHFPWVSGQTTFSTQDGYKISSFQAMPSLVIKDGTADLPTWKRLVAAHFPFSMLHEDEICPRRTLPERWDEPAEVILLQLTFVRGGFILTFTGQHNCMDIAGQVQLIRLLAKACRREPLTDDEVKDGNLARRYIIPVLGGEEKRDEGTAPSMAARTDTEEESEWVYFVFSGESLKSLKKEATASVTTEFVSTDDVLSGFLWQSITRARRPRMEKATTSSFQRQVDVRRHLDLSPTYTGMAVYAVTTSATKQQLMEEELGVLASRLRSTLLHTDVGYQARLAATLAEHQINDHGYALDKPTPRKTIAVSDLKMSSWAKEDCYGIDFGSVIGKPAAVRRPDFPGWEGLLYLLPKRHDGEIVAAVNMCPADLHRLREDRTFTKYAQYIG